MTGLIVLTLLRRVYLQPVVTVSVLFEVGGNVLGKFISTDHVALHRGMQLSSQPASWGGGLGVIGIYM